MVVEVVPDIGGDPAKAVEMSVLLETTISSEDEYQVKLKEWEEQNDKDKQKWILSFITDRLVNGVQYLQTLRSGARENSRLHGYWPLRPSFIRQLQTKRNWPG